MRVTWSILFLALALASFLASHVEAGVAVSVAAGAQRDAPAVWDGGRFDSQGSFQPLISLSTTWPRQARLRLELEGLFSRRSFASAAFVTDTPIRADFIEWAFIGLWRVRGSEHGWQLSALCGTQLGARLSARRRFRDVDQDVTNQLKEQDLKVLGGLRLAPRSGSAKPFAEVRFALGLTDLDNTGLHQIHARTVVLRIGYAR